MKLVLTVSLVAALTFSAQAQNPRGIQMIRDAAKMNDASRSSAPPPPPRANPTPNPSASKTTAGGARSTELHKAAQTGSIGQVKEAAANGADLNARDPNGNTALHLAAYQGNLETVTFLLDNKSDINARESRYCTPLLLAASNGHTEVVKLLLERGADVTLKQADGTSVLHKAAAGGHADVVALLLEAPGLDVNLKDRNGRTPLAQARKYKAGQWEKAVELLTQKGATE